MNVRSIFLLITLLLLTGCASTDGKLVDLSAIVFILYVLLVGVKHAIPSVIKTTFFSRLSRAVGKHLKLVIYPLYTLAGLLGLLGVVLSGIHQILIFKGLVVGTLAYNVGKVVTGDDEQRKIASEIISLGTGILLALFMLWFYGADLFKSF